MSRLLVILVLSCTYVGCAGRAPATSSVPDARRVRVLERDEAVSAVIARTLVGVPLDAAGARPDGCTTFRIPSAVFPDGRPATGRQLVDGWERQSTRQVSSLQWLLQPVLASSAAWDVSLSAGEHSIRACTERPTPDWRERLRHPALWLVRQRGEGRGLEGPGGTLVEDGRVLRNPHSERSRFDTVDFVAAADAAAAALFELGRIDVAILDGADVRDLLERTPVGIRLRRAAAWDTTYALWARRSARWTSDPTFRRWLAAIVDRESMAEILFAGQAEPAYGLLRARDGPESPARRPFGATSAPRLPLLVDGGDRNAGRIAARLKAGLAPEGVEVRIEAAVGVELSRRLQTGAFALALVAHRPLISDPLLALTGTLWPVSPDSTEALSRLQAATRQNGTAARRRAADAVEQTLLDSAELIPLVKLHVWLAHDSRLRIAADVEGVPGLRIHATARR